MYLNTAQLWVFYILDSVETVDVGPIRCWLGGTAKASFRDFRVVTEEIVSFTLIMVILEILGALNVLRTMGNNFISDNSLLRKLIEP